MYYYLSKMQFDVAQQVFQSMIPLYRGNALPLFKDIGDYNRVAESKIMDSAKEFAETQITIPREDIARKLELLQKKFLDAKRVALRSEYTQSFCVELSEGERNLAATVFEYYTRAHIGQFDHLLFELGINPNYGNLSEEAARRMDSILEDGLECLQIRDILIPHCQSFGWHENLGISNSHVSCVAKIAYEMSRVFSTPGDFVLHLSGEPLMVASDSPIEIK